MKADFSGWATKADLVCSDGLTITQDAFAHQDKMKVPLVWMHGHGTVDNVLGHAILTNKKEGVWADGFFNKSDKAVHAKQAVSNLDITQMSIWANKLRQQATRVMHGTIREVSLVISGANPGANIDPLSIRHSDDNVEELDDEAIITTGLDFLSHADDGEGDSDDSDDSEGMSAAEAVASMNEQQKTATEFLVNEGYELGKTEGKTEGKDSEGDIAKQDNVGDDEEGTLMHYNPFEANKAPATPKLSHDDMASISALANSTGSLKTAVSEFVDGVVDGHIAHGIERIEDLFPEAKALTTTPDFLTRRTEWVSAVFGAARKSPFSRIKTWTADLTYEEARAKGYVTGDMKEEQYFTLASRKTTPDTVYKKQQLDRDDMLDISDFDVVVWIKGEMRLMLEEELARAILIGDGRAVQDPHKIDEEHIRPIAKDDPFYAIQITVPYTTDDGDIQAAIDAVTLSMEYYKGTGTPTLFTTQRFAVRARMLKDTIGRKLYPAPGDLAAEMGVDKVVPVEVMNGEDGLIGVIVNMHDYVVGADKGGEVNLFDDFDIDYNKHKWLIETRISGALAVPKAAIVIRAAGLDDVAVEAEKPTQDKTTWDVTIPSVTGVVYIDAEGTTVSGNVSLAPGEDIRVNATPDTGYYLKPGKQEWTFMRPTGS